jgi:hypothetical protein
MTTPTTTLRKHTGGCHCGAVRFEAELDASAGTMCNCSICTKLGAVGVIAKPAAFQLVSGEAELSTYEWGGRISQRRFCKHCGVYCFAFGHLDVLGGDYVSINLNSLEDFDLSRTQLAYWDGRHNNWQAGPRDAPWPVSA